MAARAVPLTLEEAVTPSAAELVTQRRVVRERRRLVGEWRHAANEDRPHEAFGDVTPALLYRRPPRRHPRKLIKPDAPSWREACTLTALARFCLTGAVAVRQTQDENPVWCPRISD